MERFATRATITIGLLALAGIRVVLHVNDWLVRELTPEKVSRAFQPQAAHVSAVGLPEDVLLEECACANGEPCIACFDEGLVPHSCH